MPNKDFFNEEVRNRQLMKSFFLNSVASILGVSASTAKPILHYEIDSRKVIPGSLFFALKGAKVDSHGFLQEVADKGAIGAVVRKDYKKKHDNLTLLKVEDPAQALIDLAHFFVENEKIYTMGITGSVGKTTTKDFLYTLLQGRGNVHKTKGNRNTEIGLPLSILNREKEHTLFVAEMGISKRGDMKKLTSIAPPKIAAITTIALAHTYHLQGGLEEIFREKSEIFLSSTEKKILPMEWSRKSDEITFSTQDCKADYFLQRKGELFHIEAFGKPSPSFRLPFFQEHFQHNFMVAAAMAKEYGLSWEEIFSQLPLLKAPSDRFQVITKNGITIVNDAYNAAPIAVEKALKTFSLMEKKGRGIAVLGDMKELGPFEKSEHEKMAKLAFATCDIVFFLGKNWKLPLAKNRQKATFFCTSVQEVEEELKKLLQPKDALLLKGARKWALENLIEKL